MSHSKTRIMEQESPKWEAFYWFLFTAGGTMSPFLIALLIWANLPDAPAASVLWEDGEFIIYALAFTGSNLFMLRILKGNWYKFLGIAFTLFGIVSVLFYAFLVLDLFHEAIPLFNKMGMIVVGFIFFSFAFTSSVFLKYNNITAVDAIYEQSFKHRKSTQTNLEKNFEELGNSDEQTNSEEKDNSDE